jgi:hypothetical protein
VKKRKHGWLGRLFFLCQLFFLLPGLESPDQGGNNQKEKHQNQINKGFLIHKNSLGKTADFSYRYFCLCEKPAFSHLNGYVV